MKINILSKTLIATAASLAAIGATASPLFAQRPGEMPTPMTPEQSQQQHHEECQSQGHGNGHHSGTMGSGHSHNHHGNGNHNLRNGVVSPEQS